METVKNPRNNRVNNRNKRGSKTNSVAFQAKTPAEQAKAEVRRAAKSGSGKYVVFETTGEKGLMVGAAMLEGWPVYVVVDRDRKVRFVESTQRFEYLGYDINLSVLNYLRNNEPGFIEDIVAEEVAKVCDRQGMITPIVVQRQPEQQKPAFKANGKKQSTSKAK